jgi:hypothetical protein
MEYSEIVDGLAHEFLLVKMKRELDEIHDPEALRRACIMLIDLAERQKAMFKAMLVDMLNADDEAIRHCE